MVSETYVAAHFPLSLERQLRLQAAEMRLSKAELLRRSVTYYLAELEKKNQKGAKKEGDTTI